MRMRIDCSRMATRRTFVVFLAASMTLMLGACGGDSGREAVIESYVEAYNAGDVDAVMEVFVDDAVITGHPLGDFNGAGQIRALHAEEANGVNAYTISNVTTDGEIVTWDHVWRNEAGEEFCVEGHEAVVEGAKIASWDWPSTDFQC